MSNLGHQARSFLFLNLFVLTRSSTDWMRPTHIREGNGFPQSTHLNSDTLRIRLDHMAGEKSTTHYSSYKGYMGTPQPNQVDT